MQARGAAAHVGLPAGHGVASWHRQRDWLAVAALQRGIVGALCARRHPCEDFHYGLSQARRLAGYERWRRGLARPLLLGIGRDILWSAGFTGAESDEWGKRRRLLCAGKRSGGWLLPARLASRLRLAARAASFARQACHFAVVCSTAAVVSAAAAAAVAAAAAGAVASCSRASQYRRVASSARAALQAAMASRCARAMAAAAWAARSPLEWIRNYYPPVGGRSAAIPLSGCQEALPPHLGPVSDGQDPRVRCPR